MKPHSDLFTPRQYPLPLDYASRLAPVDPQWVNSYPLCGCPLRLQGRRYPYSILDEHGTLQRPRSVPVPCNLCVGKAWPPPYAFCSLCVAPMTSPFNAALSYLLGVPEDPCVHSLGVLARRVGSCSDGGTAPPQRHPSISGYRSNENIVGKNEETLVERRY